MCFSMLCGKGGWGAIARGRNGVKEASACPLDDGVSAVVRVSEAQARHVIEDARPRAAVDRRAVLREKQKVVEERKRERRGVVQLAHGAHAESKMGGNKMNGSVVWPEWQCKYAKAHELKEGLA